MIKYVSNKTIVNILNLFDVMKKISGINLYCDRWKAEIVKHFSGKNIMTSFNGDITYLNF